VIRDEIPTTLTIPHLAFYSSLNSLNSSKESPTKPVLGESSRIINFLRSLMSQRPRKLKQKGLMREKVFGCDLREHLNYTCRDIPFVLKCCAEFIEKRGIVDGIYRLSGVKSNISKLRHAFDEGKAPNLEEDSILQDIHCVASLLKMYFRELPNPLLTYQL